jgi:4-alpha-glucanotransferase
VLKTRSSGVLLHISSLPSPTGIGGFGPGACQFVDFLKAAGQQNWQILPLNPAGACNSPYDAGSVMAGNKLFISPEGLIGEGLIDNRTFDEPSPEAKGRVDYQQAQEQANDWLDEAFSKAGSLLNDSRFEDFCRSQSDWLEEYALSEALRRSLQEDNWWLWPEGLRDRHPSDLRDARKALGNEMLREKFIQFLFFRQWHELKLYANSRNVRLIGDLPFYVSRRSAEVWAAPELFKLDEKKQPRFITGVPPDRFSADGQLWGNPAYDWEAMRRTEYDWWMRRLQHNFSLYDIVRLDHFRGFAAGWEVPFGSGTAKGGHWEAAPGSDFLVQLFRRFPFAPLLAEDLGTITPDVRGLINQFKLPGAAVLQFAFEDDTGSGPYIPHQLQRNCVVYPGTHDNNTTRGWFEEETDGTIRTRLCDYLGREVTADTIAEALIRLGSMSAGRMFIATMQDWLGLGSEARINSPGTTNGNWQWRLRPDQLTPALSSQMARISNLYGRSQTT